MLMYALYTKATKLYHIRLRNPEMSMVNLYLHRIHLWLLSICTIYTRNSSGKTLPIEPLDLRISCTSLQTTLPK